MGLILASGSPRRRMMLTTAGIPIASVRPADIDESRRGAEDPIAYARRLALEKAGAVSAPGHWILAADTVVHIEDAIYAKPADAAEARRFLRALSGTWHEVTTAWCLRWGGGAPVPASLTFHEHVTTRVLFRSLSEAEMGHYIATGEGRDKAGGYGVQGLGAVLVEELRGSYTNVVGLPLAPVLAALGDVGIRPLPPGAPS